MENEMKNEVNAEVEEVKEVNEAAEQSDGLSTTGGTHIYGESLRDKETRELTGFRLIIETPETIENEDGEKEEGTARRALIFRTIEDVREVAGLVNKFLRFCEDECLLDPAKLKKYEEEHVDGELLG